MLGEKNRRIRELTSLIQQRFNLNQVELYAEKVMNRGTCAVAQAESLRFKLAGGLAVRRACYGVLRYIMENGAKGCEIVVSGKLRAQRAKAMKFRSGYMIKSGHAARDYVDTAVRHLKLKQGVLGIRVAIMLPYDPKGKHGCSTIQSDVIEIHEPKAAPVPITQPLSAPVQPQQTFDAPPAMPTGGVPATTAPIQTGV